MSDERFKPEERSFTKYSPSKPKLFEKTKSRHAFGTPMIAETLFQQIEDNKTDSAAFVWARKLMAKYNDDQIWEMYACWVRGEIHVDLQKK